jgi:hypothetical protein
MWCKDDTMWCKDDTMWCKDDTMWCKDDGSKGECRVCVGVEGAPNASERAPLVMGISEAQLKRNMTNKTGIGAAWACSMMGTAVLNSPMLPKRNPSCTEKAVLAVLQYRRESGKRSSGHFTKIKELPGLLFSIAKNGAWLLGKIDNSIYGST